MTGLYLKGSGELDDIRLSVASVARLEDAEDGQTSRWQVMDNDPEGASIRVVEDAEQGKVIRFSGQGTQNAYRYQGEIKQPSHQRLSWAMRFSEYYAIYIEVDTEYGRRVLKYTPDTGRNSLAGNQLRLPLGHTSRNGQWQQIERNLQADIHALEPENAFIKLRGLYLKGSGQLDNLHSAAQ